MKRELAMGVNAVSALVDEAPEKIVRCWYNKSSRRIENLVDQLERLGVPVESADGPALDRRSGGVRHQGVIVEFLASQPIDLPTLQQRLEHTRNPLLLILDGVTDPHNLGACMRSAAAAGAVAVVVPKDRAAGLTPVARRTAAGAAERIPLAVVTNLARALAALGEQGVWRVGLSADSATSIYDADLTGPLALVMGSEERGLRRLTREHCDQLVHIPMAGDVDSLNVSVAAGVALFEALRARTVA